MKEQDYFYFRNGHGVMERHHVSTFGNFINGRTGEQPPAARKTAWQPVPEAGGKSATKANNPDTVFTSGAKSTDPVEQKEPLTTLSPVSDPWVNIAGASDIRLRGVSISPYQAQQKQET